MAKLDKNRMIFGLMLIILIAVAEIIGGAAKMPLWSAFMVMIFFFVVHEDKTKIPHIIIGGLFGMANLIIVKIFLGFAAPSLGLELARLIYILIFVYAIVALGEIIPVVFNAFAFMFFLVTALAAKTPDFNIYVSMAVEVVIGLIFVYAILGMARIVAMLAMRGAAIKANS
ncbi:MAG TPA: hypothetical protein VMU29_06960 [Smithella sp.]|nr:hypothetical protein [Smithella sp.]